jgi:hypothetical protein
MALITKWRPYIHKTEEDRHLLQTDAKMACQEHHTGKTASRYLSTCRRNPMVLRPFHMDYCSPWHDAMTLNAAGDLVNAYIWILSHFSGIEAIGVMPPRHVNVINKNCPTRKDSAKNQPPSCLSERGRYYPCMLGYEKLLHCLLPAMPVYHPYENHPFFSCRCFLSCSSSLNSTSNCRCRGVNVL